MCGIAGFADSFPLSSGFDAVGAGALVRRMCAAIRHRGPDDEGVLVEPGVALGMRRLSIIDVATGHQPIHSEDSRVWVVFNGEIYNFRELRRELEAAGHVFYTATDTEVIVHAYEEWGRGALVRLRGMFALAIWDRESRRVLVARDRLGIKPLYYAVAGGRLYFGSEIKSLLEAPEIPRDLSAEALDHYLSFLYAPRDASFFRAVSKLPPGHSLTWQDGRAVVEPYWELPVAERFEGSDEEAVDRLHAVLRDAVRSHLVSDVPLGAFLSGGVDSSLVVALMAEATGAPVKTFSIGFGEPRYDELAFARRVADRFATDHHEEVVTADAVGVLDRLVTHFDEPFGDASAIPTWYVSQLAAKHVTVVLSGDGGDELFGGYDRYLPDPRVAAIDRRAPAVRPLAGWISAVLPSGARGKRFLGHLARSQRGRYLDAIGFFGADDKRALLSGDLRRQLGAEDPEQQLARRFDRFELLPWPSQMMRFDLETYLPEDILTKVDRMSMAHSIESRVPLLDNAVVEFAASLPPALKIRGGRRKHVLKEVAARFLPLELIDRRKQGFAVPLDLWLRGDLRELAADTLLSSRCLQRGYFQPAGVRRLVHEHLSGRRDHALRLWQLVVLERWHQRYVDPESGSFLPRIAPSFPPAA